MEGVLKIPPVRKLQHDGSVSHIKCFRKIVVGVNNEQVGCRLVSPLETGVEVYIFLLFVVLCKSRKEKFICHCYVDPGANEPKGVCAPRLRKVDMVIVRADSEAHIGLESVTKFCGDTES